MTNNILVLTTAGSEEEARKLSSALVERRLAACVNVVPRVLSIYRWQEKIEESEEWLLVIKTTSALSKKVESAIRELHSYDLPECVVLTIEGGSEAYLKWIGSSVGEPGH